MLSDIIARILIVSAGILYPTFCSFKAIRLKDPYLYVKWTAYWVTFALLHTIEQLLDQFIYLIPFYLELKIVLVFWLVTPSSAGSSKIYSRYIHRAMAYLEDDIELLISWANSLGYSFILKAFSNSYLLGLAMVFKTKDLALQFLRQQLSVSETPPTTQDNKHHTTYSTTHHTDPSLNQTNASTYNQINPSSNAGSNASSNAAYAQQTADQLMPLETNIANMSYSKKQDIIGMSLSNVNPIAPKRAVSGAAKAGEGGGLGRSDLNRGGKAVGEQKAMSYYERYLKK